MKYTEKQIEEILSKNLSKKRLEHTMGVCKCAIDMAQKYGVDEKKAYISALLHDCAKGMSIDEQIEYAKKHNIELSKEDMDCLPVIHATIGAKIAETEYGVCDKSILDAIRYHTVAREDMSDLEKIIYSADMLEPGRDFEGVEELRALLQESLDVVFKECLKTSLVFNINGNKTVHNDSLKSWNRLIKKGN